MVDQGPPVDAQCPSYAVALGYMGVASAVCLSNWGSAVSMKTSVIAFVLGSIRAFFGHGAGKDLPVGGPGNLVLKNCIPNEGEDQVFLRFFLYKIYASNFRFP